MDGGFNADGTWLFGDDGHECTAALNVRCPKCRIMVVEFTEADLALLEIAARRDVRYLEDYSPDDDTDW